MPNYQEGKIYKIFNTITDDTYIGSTTQLLCNRLKSHREQAKHTSFMYKLYVCLRKHRYDKFYIELLEKYPCSSKEELTAREGQWIRKEAPSLNSRIEGRTKKEYYEDNQEEIKAYKREFRSNNKEHMKELDTKYYARKKNAEEFKETQKLYYETNKELLAEKHKQWRANNIEHCKKYNAEKVTCECGCVVNKKHLIRHKTTQKHKDIMDTKS